MKVKTDSREGAFMLAVYNVKVIDFKEYLLFFVGLFFFNGQIYFFPTIISMRVGT